MKQGFRARYAGDPFSLVLIALLLLAAAWLFLEQVTGGRALLAQLLFGFALGLFLGNLVRLMIGMPRS